jgi:hypothetical protein
MLALHLLQVSLVYVNTLMIQQVLAEPDWQDRLTAVDLRALSPLKWQHVNSYGTFTRNMKERLLLERVAGSALRVIWQSAAGGILETAKIDPPARGFGRWSDCRICQLSAAAL